MGARLSAASWQARWRARYANISSAALAAGFERMHTLHTSSWRVHLAMEKFKRVLAAAASMSKSVAIKPRPLRRFASRSVAPLRALRGTHGSDLRRGRLRGHVRRRV